MFLVERQRRNLNLPFPQERSSRQVVGPHPEWDLHMGSRLRHPFSCSQFDGEGMRDDLLVDFSRFGGCGLVENERFFVRGRLDPSSDGFRRWRSCHGEADREENEDQ